MRAKIKLAVKTALLWCAVLALILSVFFVVIHTHHDCAGESCGVCVQLHRLDDLLKTLFSAMGFVLFGVGLFFGLRGDLPPLARIRNAGENTPAGQKIRLNN